MTKDTPYDMSFLSKALLVMSNIERNPGPTGVNQNTIGKSPMKGRPTKRKGFQGTPKKEIYEKVQKVDFDAVQTLSLNNIKPWSVICPSPKKQCVKVLDMNNYGNASSAMNSNIPLGLMNKGENVCFFNSVIQVLYAIPAFRDIVLTLPAPSSNGTVNAIKRLFDKIKNSQSSNSPVRTSTFIHDIDLRDYEFGRQYDAHECLLQLLGKFYPEIDNNCMFKVSWLESTICENEKVIGNSRIQPCFHRTENMINHFNLTLEVDATSSNQTITQLLNRLENSSLAEGYTCDNCQFKDTSNKVDLISETSDVLIFQLKLFKYIREYNTTTKVIPNLTVDEDLHLFGQYWTLHGIIYHQGEQAISGHYTCGINVNDTWYTISDTRVEPQQNKIRLSCRQYNRDSSVPYILIYKKRNDVVARIPNLTTNTIEIADNQLGESANTIELQDCYDVIELDDCQSGIDGVVPMEQDYGDYFDELGACSISRFNDTNHIENIDKGSEGNTATSNNTCKPKPKAKPKATIF
ncbi:MAG: ubiquitin carboxyl-terminal hydrolase, partial [Nitrosopumilus sp.]|nr:ubiquitin carboxyl-terminal hydrolase [Nitrosopumilus sp.]